MDRKAPAVSSSSQNVRTILSIEERGAGRDQLRLSLDDGSSFFILTEDPIPFLLEPGTLIDDEKFLWLENANNKYCCRKKCLDLLAVKGEFSGTLKRKLQKRGFSEDGIVANLEWLKLKGYLNDFDLAVHWINSRLKRNPEGKSVMKAALLSKGVSRENAEMALEEVDETLWKESLSFAIRKKISSGKEPDTIIRFFCRKGFSYNEVKRIIEEISFSDYND